MFKPFALKNPLQFPGGRAPGFDPTHPAASNWSRQFCISTIPIAGDFVDIATATAGAVQSINGITTIIGPAIQNLSGSTNTFSRFTVSSFTPSKFLAAQIVIYTTIPGANYQISLGLGGASNRYAMLLAGSTGRFGSYDSNGTGQSTFVPTANVPYFMATSWNGGTTVNVFVLNLSTGATFTQAVANTGNFGTPTSYTIGSLGGNHAWEGSLAALMFNPNIFLSLSQLRAWAADPWSFWYPPALEEIISLSITPITAAPPTFVLMPQIQL